MKFKQNENCSEKIISFLEYFAGKIPMNKIDKEKDRAYKLDLAIKIYNSDKLELDKLLELQKLYKTPEHFRKAYSDLEKYGDDELLSFYVSISKEIYEYYKNLYDKGLVAVAKEWKEKEELKYFEDYFGAVQLIEYYIKYDYSPMLRDFLVEFGISEHAFYRYVNIIETLDPELYDKFYEKCQSNRNERKANTLEKINNLYTGITTGMLPNGEEFNKIEVYRNLPLYDDQTSREVLGDFDIKNLAYVSKRLRTLFDVLAPEKSKTIMDYIYKENIVGITNPAVLKEQEVYDIEFSQNGRDLTDEDKKTILNFMREKHVPLLNKAFYEVRDAYYSGKIEVNKDKKLMKEGN